MRRLPGLRRRLRRTTQAECVVDRVRCQPLRRQTCLYQEIAPTGSNEPKTAGRLG